MDQLQKSEKLPIERENSINQERKLLEEWKKATLEKIENMMTHHQLLFDKAKQEAEEKVNALQILTKENLNHINDCVNNMEGSLFSTIDDINLKVIPNVNNAQRIAQSSMTRLDNLWKYRNNNKNLAMEDGRGHRIKVERLQDYRLEHKRRDNTREGESNVERRLTYQGDADRNNSRDGIHNKEFF